MSANYQTELYERVHVELSQVAVIDCHEHLQRERELPTGDNIHL